MTFVAGGTKAFRRQLGRLELSSIVHELDRGWLTAFSILNAVDELPATPIVLGVIGAWHFLEPSWRKKKNLSVKHP